MNATVKGIVIAVALAVVAIIFVFPGLSPFSTAAGSIINESNNPTATTTMPSENASSLQVTDETIGTGAVAEAGDTVTVNYVGMLTDGTVFDASANHGNQGFTFTLGAGQVIAGWDQGIAGMKEGGKRKLVIPPSLAYGNQAVGNIIPANSTLVFEVELLKVQK